MNPEIGKTQLRLLEISFTDPAENLAFDEVLLNGLEAGRSEETLRFWESPELFVVLGLGQARREEARLDACEKNGVPVMRRCSAGGCVVQGPGCLNFALALKYDRSPDLRSINRSYRYILGRLASAFRKRGINVEHDGISDLALDGMKVSGNAQRRLKTAVLHHGTLLYGLDPDLMEKYLIEPDKRPDYRNDRRHTEFVRSLPMEPARLRKVVVEAFGPLSDPQPPESWETETARILALEKYANPKWRDRR
jgi:lipoate-protein ligase A